MGITLIILICLAVAIVFLATGIVKKNKINTIIGGCIFLISVIIYGFVIFSMSDPENLILENEDTVEETTVQNEVIPEEAKKDSANEVTIKGVELEFKSDEVQKIYPFTGAYPHVWSSYLYKLSSDGINNISKNGIFDNDFILKLAFSKVTKEDWLAGYVSEAEATYIKTEKFDEYVKDIFGNITYEKKEFDATNLDMYEFDGGLYSCRFKDDVVEIDLSHGNFNEFKSVHMAYKEAIKYDGKIEITVKPYVVDRDEQGERYTAYARYNYITQELEDKLLDLEFVELEGEYSNISDEQYDELTDLVISGTENGIKYIPKLSEEYINKLDTFVFVYNLDSKTGEYYLNDILKK